MDTKESAFLRIKLSVTDVPKGIFEGYGAVFGNVDQGGDMLLPGAFNKSLARHRADGTKPAMLWHHKQDEPIGRWIELREDEVGLFVRGQFNLDTPGGQRAHSHVKQGDVSGLSIGYTVPPGAANSDQRAPYVTKVTEVELEEVSVVTLPMNKRARILSGKADLEELLVKSGVANAAAKKIVASGWAGLSQKAETKRADALASALEKSLSRIRKS